MAASESPAVVQAWQDVISKPSHAWGAQLGYGDGSQLAWHVDRLTRTAQSHFEVIKQLHERIVALEAIVAGVEPVLDPNFVDPNIPDANEVTE